ncbi:hypothetical protein JCM10212_005442 [Sporobolomyces blumeae]
MDPALIKFQVQASNQYLIAFTAILIWDTLAMLPTEMRHIWQICKRVFWLETLCLVYVILATDIILAIRVYAMWQRTRSVGTMLVAMIFVEAGLLVGSATQVRPLILPDAFKEYLNFHGCVAGDFAPGMNFVPLLLASAPMVVNSILLFATVYRSYKVSRDCGGIKIPLLERMARDGLQYYVAITATNLVNIYFYAQSNPTIRDFNICASLVLSSVLSCRLALALFEPAAEPSTFAGQSDKPTTFVRPGPSSSGLLRPRNGRADDEEGCVRGRQGGRLDSTSTSLDPTTGQLERSENGGSAPSGEEEENVKTGL